MGLDKVTSIQKSNHSPCFFFHCANLAEGPRFEMSLQTIYCGCSQFPHYLNMDGSNQKYLVFCVMIDRFCNDWIRL